jgi:uncharacterized SAM-binding protein YcdF (DUF218 family)
MIRKALEAIFLPPLALFLLALLGLALSVRRPRFGRALAALAVSLLVLLSVPVVAAALLRPLERSPAFDASAVPDEAAIVVLGADLRAFAPEYERAELGALTLERVRMAAHVARRTGLPVLACGGVIRPGTPPVAALIARTLAEDYGVEARWRDEASRTTRENAEHAAEILREAGIGSAVLVTHAWHVPRAAAELEARGLAVVPAPTGAHPWPGWHFGAFVPSAVALRDSCWALHEWAGGAVYALTR